MRKFFLAVLAVVLIALAAFYLKPGGGASDTLCFKTLEAQQPGDAVVIVYPDHQQESTLDRQRRAAVPRRKDYRCDDVAVSPINVAVGR